MRLWHHDLLPYLPRSQLLAQWRELNSIYAKEDQHVLINYIYEYPKEDLYAYSLLVIAQMQARGFQIRAWDKYEAYFAAYRTLKVSSLPRQPFIKHHDGAYLNVCFFNLYEKFVCGQKDYPVELFESLKKFWLIQTANQNKDKEVFLNSLLRSIS